MAFKTKIWLTILIVTGFETFASILSKSFQFDYARLRWVLLAIYLVAGYWGAHRRGFIHGMVLGSLAGVADSTIFWVVYYMIGTGTMTWNREFTPVFIIFVMDWVTATAFVFGSIGAGLCKVFGQTRPAADQRIKNS